MTNFDETQANNEPEREQARGGAADQQNKPQGAGLPENVLDAATGASGQVGSGGPSDANDLGRFGSDRGDHAGRDLSNEGLNQDGGATTMGTDIGSTSA